MMIENQTIVQVAFLMLKKFFADNYNQISVKKYYKIT